MNEFVSIGTKRERERILKLIDEKIKVLKQKNNQWGSIQHEGTYRVDGAIYELEQIKKELEK